MKKQQILFWIIFLIAIDQAVKIIINVYFLDIKFEIIPGLLEFKPVFNSKHSYLNSLLYKHFNINLGFWFHIILFLVAQAIFIVLHDFLKKNTIDREKILDTGLVFQISGFVCALIGNIIWENGILDFIYLKPLFIFDFKDVYLNCFAILFIIFVHKHNKQIKHFKTKDIIQYSKTKLKRWNEETISYWKSKR
ncbi:MAG TPA: signal peptidase II [Porphyromonadaceae bacterium]|jgi:hypothetical protein|nr:signal peptidase II [Porphyromonadaceae bacterium]HBF95551.1 signal peptidase II [Porphyromonadaceae bacterium]HBG80504.1 signal peptidase II [Porphyromonadaceae bacterium]HBK40949.1 signal peptidase II [Porphyromonadaceae bacterium]HBQ57921.1 signal peptidase II [Porphyromonadaceae bacterium]